MFNGHDWMWGMHWSWWIVWIAVIVLVVVLLTRAGGSTEGRRESPLDILERRYAAGEISTEDYEERRARLLREPQ